LAKVHDDLLGEARAFFEAIDEEPLPRFLAGLDWAMRERRLEPRPLPCLGYLPAAAEIAGGPGRRLAALLAASGDRLSWGQTYGEADLGKEFIERYGWTEVFGTRGHFENDGIAGGFLLLGPQTLYPDHRHEAEEVYVPLTGGTEWRMADGAFRRRQAGEVIHHRPNVGHAMRTGEDPLLAIYLWRGGPLAARSTLVEAALEGGRTAHPGGGTPPLRREDGPPTAAARRRFG